MRSLRMAATLLPLAVIAAAAAAALAPSAQAVRRAPCRPAGATTIVQNPSVRVYEVSRGEDGSTMYGCRKATGRRLRLDNASEGLDSSDVYGDVRLNGNEVAWTSTLTDQSCRADCPPDFDANTVRIAVADVRSRTRRTLPAEPTGGALVVSRNGGVAWAAKDASGATEIHASVRGAEDEVLDSGAIDPSSLAVELTIVSWTRDGVERFARLR